MLPKTQLTLSGFGSSEPTDRLFFAVFPDPDTAARIAALAQTFHGSYGLRGRPLRPERLHMTLFHLGDYAGLPPALVGSAVAAIHGVHTTTFDVIFDSVASFSGRRANCPLVLRSSSSLEALHDLRREIGAYLTTAGLGRFSGHTFTPHVTLLYDNKTLAPQVIPPISWTVHEFLLIHSLLGRTEHRVLGRWELHHNE